MFTEKLLSRFWSKVDAPYGECWLWQASFTHNGYGEFSVAGVAQRAHRLAWLITHGATSTWGLHVMHTCDNRACCNPDHLFLGTNKDNHIDKMAKGRGNQPRGERHGHVKLTESDIPAIRGMLAGGQTQMAVARHFGVSASAISKVHLRRKWRHIP